MSDPFASRRRRTNHGGGPGEHAGQLVDRQRVDDDPPVHPRVLRLRRESTTRGSRPGDEQSQPWPAPREREEGEEQIAVSAIGAVAGRDADDPTQRRVQHRREQLHAGEIALGAEEPAQDRHAV